ncbi:unnamed protein product [Moneuplotes crassus]|uniref:Uncharacterized protein n=1 Tax=Euplotes crassus TaxID=5936 RepID=A0AAD1UB26_EUPCR|nr:unnamed protein product [Moneuplotes crassus]
MDTLRSKQGLVLRLKAINRTILQTKIPDLNHKLNYINRLLKKKRKQRFLNPKLKNHKFVVKRKKVYRITRNQKSVSFSRTANRFRSPSLKKNIRPRITAKSPDPQYTLISPCSPDGKEFDKVQQRYMSIIKKAQDAIGKSPRGFDSPRILKKVLSAWESSKNQEEDNKESLSPMLKDRHSLQNNSGDFEPTEISDFRLRAEPSTFSAMVAHNSKFS